MKNSKYWQGRFEQLEKASHREAVDTYRQIEQSFIEAQKNIEKEISRWYMKFVDNNEISMSEAKRLLSTEELKEFKWDVKEYIKYGQENAIDQQWMKELENASAKFHISRLEALKINTQQYMEKAFGNELDEVDRMTRNMYTNNYYHTMFEVQKGFNVGFNIGTIDENKLSKIVSKPWAIDEKNFSERIWGNKTALINELHKQLTLMCVQGKAPDKTIVYMAKKFNTTKKQAGNLVMTESAYFSELARKDCFKDLDVEQYEIVATLDSHTSKICQEQDGKVYNMKDYQTGITAPPFHNYCRSTTVPYFDDDYDMTDSRAARGDDGKTYYVPSNMKYNEWYEKYVTNSNKGGIINDNPSFKRFLLRSNERLYTEKEIKQIANETYEIANKYTENESKWSGKVLISNRQINAKLWNCNIEIERNTSPHTILHEQLHAHSISYYNKEIYRNYRNIEEATVELLTKEIGKKEGIVNVKSDYDELINNLKKINNKVHIAKNDFEFAQKLFNMPVTQRLDFLENEIQKYLVDKTIDEAIEINKVMEELYAK